MDFCTRHVRNFVSFLHFLSVVLWLLYLYFKLWEFIDAAILLKYLNVQTVSFILYSFLLVLLPSAVIYLPKYSKKRLYMFICFSISAVILAGTIGDLITYKFFRRYTFAVGDAVFCNILMGVPNLYGTMCCLALSFAYFLFGKYVTENRFAACFIYLFIVLIGVAPALIYSFDAWGTFPRQTWIEKAAFITPHQVCLLVSFILSSMSDVIWKRYMG